MSYETLGDVLAHYVRIRGLGGLQEQYKHSLWQDTQAQLQKFIQHLNEDGMDDMYSANCNNTPWQHPDYPTETTDAVPSMGDIIICTLMTRALWFANGWSKAPDTDMEDDSGGNRELKDFIRCGIVNMFMHLLEESACNSPSGISYAWHTMQHMNHVQLFGGNLIHAGTCHRAMGTDIQVHGWSMKKSIKQWLRAHDSIRTTIKNASVSTNCSRKIGELPTQGPGAKNTENGDKVHEHVVGAAKNLSTGLATIFREIKKAVKASGSNGEQPQSPMPDSPSEDSDDDDVMDDDEDDDDEDDEGHEDDANAKKTQAPPVKVPEVQKEVVTEKKDQNNKADTPSSPSSAGRNDSTAGPDGQPQAPASPVLPARPPPPPPPRPSTPTPGPQGGEQEAGTDGAPGPPAQAGSAQGEAGTGSTGHVGCQGSGVTSSSVSVSCGTHTGPGLSPPNIPAGITVIVQDATSGPGDAVVDGGSDDAPPLNPPKPKPNPNPDQSGCSGSAEGGTGNDQTAASSGGSAPSPPAAAGGGGTSSTSGSSTINRHDTPRLDLNFGRYTVGVGGSYGPYGKPVTPVGKSTNEFDDNIPPIFTAKDIFLSSPILIFVACVTSLILLFFLGKASTIGTSSGNGTSQYGTEVGATYASAVGTTSVSLSDRTDIAKRGERNFYGGRATGSPVKNTVFDDMRNKLKPKLHVQNRRPLKKKPQGGTAQNKLKECCQKLKRCKMGRRAWSILIVVATVLYSFFMPIFRESLPTTFFSISSVFSALTFLYGIPILIPIIYCCVLVCFCRSKTAKCLLDKIWKKKEKEEAPTETEKKEGEVNKKPETPGKQKVPGKPEVPNNQEASGILEVPKKPETPGKSDVPQKQETPKKPEVSNKTELPGITEVPKKPELRAKAQLAVKPESSGKSEVPKKAEVPKKSEAPAKIKLPWKLKLSGKP
ncbi:hypothetical protein AK88_05487 [Plasmodium fragile]|uniref:Schizont-infected cell agglutination extracellular alpha domain-containing protein n=2 Tax=Plasmodium fragile TaxID=5857 RepID=A0A0D9QGM9_PLAFR|nr:uncharacterized protein AK88_05487 [Plasmodium fragile]KJP84881.1 hypothetical protein AK88_05487 [Plasmodium fragile]